MLANKHIRNLRPYPIVSHEAWEFSDDEKILKLDWNEATAPPSPRVKEKIENFLSGGRLNWYPDTNNEKLLNAIAEYCQVQSENIQYFAGSDSLHEYIIGSFTEPGDKVTMVSPTYDNFRASSESRGAFVNRHRLKEPFNFQLDEFCRHLEKYKSKLVYICNPNNPTGTVYEESSVEALLHSFPHTLFIIDEAYYEFTKRSAKDMAVKYRNAVVSRTFSKAFALAGFRIGYAISSVENIQFLNKIRNPKNVTALSQTAAMAALEDLSHTEHYVREVLETKQWICDKLRGAKKPYFSVFSGGGNFILLKMSPGSQKGLTAHLRKAKIFVRDCGHIEGMEGYIRLTVGTRKQMTRFLEEFFRFNNV